ncbi:MAG TPA: hypothetical protein VM912_17230 [Terriglobales bacterium]|nr:hypothetical protein [Terriglobales bacterium]
MFSVAFRVVGSQFWRPDTEMELRGSISILALYDVCDEIRLKELPPLIQGKVVIPSLKHTAPEYVRFERPPLVESIEPVLIQTGERFEAALQYYDYGVISLLFRFPFSGDWQLLRELAARWVSSTSFDELSLRIVREKVELIRSALIRPYEQWLSEDYYAFHVLPESGEAADTVVARHGLEITQIVRGESGALSDTERAEVMQAAMSYYPSDLVVVGWNAAFILDAEQGADACLRLFEYANSQLLQFRHYDELLTRELRDVYRFLERRAGVLSGWRMRAAAARLRTILLEVNELTERTNTALKFVGDMFTARLYKMCVAKIGVSEYQALVANKLSTAEKLYEVMINQFQQARGFVLEVMVVIILIIELAAVFRGK